MYTYRWHHCLTCFDFWIMITGIPKDDTKDDVKLLHVKVSLAVTDVITTLNLQSYFLSLSYKLHEYSLKVS